MLGVEPLLAGVQAGDPGLERGEVVLGALGAGDGGGPGRPRAGRSPRRRRRPATSSGVHLAGEPGQPLAAVGGGAQQRRRPGGPPRPRPPRRYGVRSPPPRARCGGSRPRPRSRTPARGPARPRPRARRGRARGRALSCSEPAALRTRSAASDAVPRSRSRMPGQPEPGLLRPGQRRQVLAERGLEPALGLAGLRERGLDLLAALDQDRLVGELLLQRGARRDQVVGDDPGAGVARRRPARRRPCGRPRPAGRAA